jgi:hypothetical protein
MIEGAATRDYTIERLSKKNLGDLDRLHHAVYKKQHPPGYFIKK